jgi:hypothetical protein
MYLPRDLSKAKGRSEGSPSSGRDGIDSGGSFGNDGIKVSYLLPHLT